jgi:2-oxoglutarate ferredoxin oxidoreductase subunit beta
MAVSKKIPESIHDHTYCPGCGHGVFVRLVHEVMEEKGLLDNNICVLGVGCSATYNRMVYGGNRIEGHHGRGPSTARGAKTILPDTFIWTYQGDGDAYSIGMGETMLAAKGIIPSRYLFSTTAITA